MRLIIISFVAFLVFCVSGCSLSSDHNVHGKQDHEHNVHHDPQRLDIYIHRDRWRLRNPPPQEIGK